MVFYVLLGRVTLLIGVVLAFYVGCQSPSWLESPTLLHDRTSLLLAHTSGTYDRVEVLITDTNLDKHVCSLLETALRSNCYITIFKMDPSSFNMLRKQEQALKYIEAEMLFYNHNSAAILRNSNINGNGNSSSSSSRIENHKVHSTLYVNLDSRDVVIQQPADVIVQMYYDLHNPDFLQGTEANCYPDCTQDFESAWPDSATDNVVTYPYPNGGAWIGTARGAVSFLTELLSGNFSSCQGNRFNDDQCRMLAMHMSSNFTIARDTNAYIIQSMFPDETHLRSHPVVPFDILNLSSDGYVYRADHAEMHGHRPAIVHYNGQSKYDDFCNNKMHGQNAQRLCYFAYVKENGWHRQPIQAHDGTLVLPDPFFNVTYQTWTQNLQLLDADLMTLDSTQLYRMCTGYTR